MTRTRAWVGLAAVLALAGCSGTTAAAVVEQVPLEQQSLEIWQRKSPGGPSDQIGQELVRQFTEETGIPATLTSISQDFEIKLQQRAVQRNLPDVVINDTAQLGNMQSQGFLREIDPADIAGADDVNERAWDGARSYEGDYYGVPMTAHTVALFNRKDWREELGLDTPTDWESLVAMWRGYVEDDPAGTGKQVGGLAVPGTTERGYVSWNTSTFFWSGGGEYFEELPDGYRSAVAGEGSVEAATWIRDLACAEGVLQPGASSQDTTNAKETFQTGGAGSYLVAPYELPSLVDSLGDDIEVIPTPPGQVGLITLAEGNNTYRMAGSDSESAQERFAEFVISPQGQEIGMAGHEDGNIVRLPVNSTVDMSQGRDASEWETFQELYDENGRYVPAVPNWAPFLNASANTLNALISDCSLDVRTEMEALDQVFTAELAEQEVLAP